MMEGEGVVTDNLDAGDRCDAGGLVSGSGRWVLKHQIEKSAQHQDNRCS
jgi:hypothetical protein